jgi:hypothetical protein
MVKCKHVVSQSNCHCVWVFGGSICWPMWYRFLFCFDTNGVLSFIFVSEAIVVILSVPSIMSRGWSYGYNPPSLKDRLVSHFINYRSKKGQFTDSPYNICSATMKMLI